MNITEVVETQSDEMLERLLQMHAGHRVARDSDGNLREVTGDEIEFGQALRAEARKRGLR